MMAQKLITGIKMATSKEKYVISLLDLAKSIADNPLDKASSLTDQYFDNGYDGAGSDTIVDGDLTGFNDLVAADVTNIITALQQINNYFNNAAVSTADYSVTYNAVRYVDFG